MTRSIQSLQVTREASMQCLTSTEADWPAAPYIPAGNLCSQMLMHFVKAPTECRCELCFAEENTFLLWLKNNPVIMKTGLWKD